MEKDGRRSPRAGDQGCNVAITGASGFLGRALGAELVARGYGVRGVHRAVAPGQLAWDPTGLESPDLSAWESVDVVVHLAGENVAGRWNAAKRRSIRDSRVTGTASLVAVLAKLARPPRLLISASAIGFYGDRGDERLSETAPMGTGFLAEVCDRWEAEARAAEAAGVKVLRVRFGVILSSDGGALPQLLRPFRWGLGGVLGDGSQFFSFITLEDAVRALVWLMERDSPPEVANLVAPEPIRQRDLAARVGEELRFPSWTRTPAAVLRLALGGFADELLFSRRVMPTVLEGGGFQFRCATFPGALRSLLAGGL